MQTPATNVEGRHHRRHLGDRAGQSPGRGPGRFQGHAAHVPPTGDLAAGVQSRGGDAQDDFARVGLRQVRDEAKQSGHPTQSDQEDSSRVGVEGPAVANPAEPKDLAAPADDVVAGPASRFVDDDQPI